MDVTTLFIHFYYYVEVSLPYELACPSVSWQVGRLFGGSVIISEKVRSCTSIATYRPHIIIVIIIIIKLITVLFIFYIY